MFFKKYKELKEENKKLKAFKESVAEIMLIYDNFEIDDCVMIAHDINELLDDYMLK